MADETFEQYRARMEAINESRKTDPPTCPLGDEFNDGQDYPAGVIYGDGTNVQWRCPDCGSLIFHVFYVEGNYQTFVRCLACQRQSDVHTG